MSIRQRDFRLGNCSFRLVTKEQELLEGLSKVLPEATQQRADMQIIDLDEPLAVARSYADHDPEEESTIAMHYLIGQAVNNQPDCVWMDAAAFVTPSGQVVLLTGPSEAGKTTLTLAMTKAHGWKALAEDIMLVDVSSKLIIPTVRPSSLRPGCSRLILDATGISLRPQYKDQWYLDEEIYYDRPVPMAVSLAVSLDVITKDERGTLSRCEISQTDYLRSLLPISNALRRSDAITTLEEMLKTAKCFSFSGGGLVQRMQELLNISSSVRYRSGSAS